MLDVFVDVNVPKESVVVQAHEVCCVSRIVRSRIENRRQLSS